jgi:hypothetical protein
MCSALISSSCSSFNACFFFGSVSAYSSRGFPGRPPQDRTAIARAFVAKTIYNMPTTRALLDRLETDSALRRICGWDLKSLADMLNDLPTSCDIGTKKNSKGYKVSWSKYSAIPFLT